MLAEQLRLGWRKTRSSKRGLRVSEHKWAAKKRVRVSSGRVERNVLELHLGCCSLYTPNVSMFLTKRQKEILDFLKDFVSRNGYAPTFDEIASAFGFRSKGTVYKHIKSLKNKGIIQHEWNRTRSIEVVGVCLTL